MGGLLPIFVSATDSNRRKRRGIKPQGRINEAYSKLQVISADEGTRRLYEARLRASRDEYARIQGARQDGWQDGLDEGEKKGRREVARNLKAMGIPASQIAMGTGLSIDEIAKL